MKVPKQAKTNEEGGAQTSVEAGSSVEAQSPVEEQSGVETKLQPPMKRLASKLMKTLPKARHSRKGRKEPQVSPEPKVNPRPKNKPNSARARAEATGHIDGADQAETKATATARAKAKNKGKGKGKGRGMAKAKASGHSDSHAALDSDDVQTAEPATEPSGASTQTSMDANFLECCYEPDAEADVDGPTEARIEPRDTTDQPVAAANTCFPKQKMRKSKGGRSANATELAADTPKREKATSKGGTSSYAKELWEKASATVESGGTSSDLVQEAPSKTKAANKRASYADSSSPNIKPHQEPPKKIMRLQHMSSKASKASLKEAALESTAGEASLTEAPAHHTTSSRSSSSTSPVIPAVKERPSKAVPLGWKNVGASPKLVVGRKAAGIPQDLLPDGAAVIVASHRKPQPLPARVYESTLADAALEGLQASDLWPGLGHVPTELRRGGFRSLLILGPSGSGKSTLLGAIVNELFPEHKGLLSQSARWKPGHSLIEAFRNAEEGRHLLGSVGLNSAPSWCKPFEVLSVGEKYRANVARALQRRMKDPLAPLIFDEWTSELDRGLALSVCSAFRKRILSKSNADSVVDISDDSEEGAFEGDDRFDESSQDCCEDPEEEQVEVGEDECGKDTSDEDEHGHAYREAEIESVQSHDGFFSPQCDQDIGDTGSNSGGEEDLHDWEKACEQELQRSPPAPCAADPEMEEGPCIFATCHEDILSYLQPEYICYCLPGRAPHLVQNPHPGSPPVLQSVLQGQIEPLPRRGGEDLFIGHWAVEGHVRNFVIQLKSCKGGVAFCLVYDAIPGEKPEKVEHLQREAAQQSPSKRNRTESVPETCFRGTSSSGLDVRVRMRDRNTLLISQKTGLKFGKEQVARRQSKPIGTQAVMMASDPEEVLRTCAVASINYKHFHDGVLKDMGWYLPPEIAPDGRYTGLELDGEAQRIPPTDFNIDPLREKVQDNQYILATYVGNPDGTLSPNLREVSGIFDSPFDGLCLHLIPDLPLHDFRIGVITGPSGSGKSTLARRTFGPSMSVSWSPDVPIVGHFMSLQRAKDFCAAVHLDLNVAMRPFATLSSGEQARAQLARMLDTAVASRAAETKESKPRRPLVLEEFTSLVDRHTARQMASGIQHLVEKSDLQKIVIVSCHDDFIGAGLLEPDWVFECHNGRLVRLHSGEESSKKRAEDQWEPKKSVVLEALRAGTDSLTAMQQQLLAQMSASCFSSIFQVEIGAVRETLRVLGDRELERKQDELKDIQVECSKAVETAVTAYRELRTHLHNSARLPAGGHMVSSAAATQTQVLRDLEPPLIKLQVRRALPREWRHFRDHHYKDHTLHSASIAFVGLLEDRAVCFMAVVGEGYNYVYTCCSLDKSSGYPSTWAFQPVRKRLFREHRTVVLPDFQGLGLAPLLCDTVAYYLHIGGNDFTSQTVHPFYGRYRDNSPFWRQLPTNCKKSSEINGNTKYSHFFVGATQPDGSVDPVLAEELVHRIEFERVMTCADSGTSLPSNVRNVKWKWSHTPDVD